MGPNLEPNLPSHPDELLEAFALDALEDDEHLQVEQHLDSCPQCRSYVGQLLQTTSGLGLLLGQTVPPAALGLRIRQALARPVENSPVETGPSLRSLPPSTGNSARRRFTTPQLAMPLAAVLVVSLFSVSLFMNLQAAGRMDQMERAGSTVTAQLRQMERASATTTAEMERANSVVTTQLKEAESQSKQMEEDNKARVDQVAEAAAIDASQIMDTVNEIRTASYLLAHPETNPLVLKPPAGAGDYQGVLLVEDKGRKAFLMISDMAQPPPQLPYQVWLVRNGNRIWVGQVAVDSTGWGSLTLEPPEPMYEFDWVNLTMIDYSATSEGTETMVLLSKIEHSTEGK